MTHALAFLAVAMAFVSLGKGVLGQGASRPLTHVYLLTMNNGLASLRKAQPVRIAAQMDYTGDPAFSQDGNSLLFTANPGGTQRDVFRFDRPTGRVTQLTNSLESENSPSFLPAAMGTEGFTAIVGLLDRGQLAVFDGRGGHRILFDGISGVLRYAWLDPDLVALLVADEPVSTLRLGRISTGVTEIVASNVKELAVPSSGPRFLSFAHAEPSGKTWIDDVDVESRRRLRQLVQHPWGERLHAWMPGGTTVLVASYRGIRAWSRGTTTWRDVFDANPHNLDDLSHVAISPKGDAVAIVAVEQKKKK